MFGVKRYVGAPVLFALVSFSMGCAEGGGAPDGASDEVDAGAGIDASATPLPDPMAELPPSQSAQTETFRTADNCAICHLAATSDAMRDAAGRDVSQARLWRSSMMRFSARDPIYLAAFAHEIESIPAAQASLEAICTRCHAPAASHELSRTGEHLTFEALTSGTRPVDVLGREGVTCTMCHQIGPEGLGTEASFTGGFVIGEERLIFGPHADPDGSPMVTQSGFTPVEADHLGDSGACASCHTVITRAFDDAGEVVGPPFPEQVPYLEWRNSEYAIGGPREASCQDCHTPPTDLDGAPIETVIANRPATLEARSPYARHTFRGANSYGLGLIAANQAWVGTDVTNEEIIEAAQRSDELLRTSATVTIESAVVEGGRLHLTVQVENHCGHKFPTSYPTRRAWLRVTARDAESRELWVSGAVNDQGALIDGEGRVIEGPYAPLRHRSRIDREDQVQVWHTEMADLEGRRTHVLLRAAGYLLDNRILPHGFSDEHPDAALSAPVGTEGDEDFIAGFDTVDYYIPAEGVASVRVELLYQPVTPTSLDALVDHPTEAYARLHQMVQERPPMPSTVDTAMVVR